MTPENIIISSILLIFGAFLIVTYTKLRYQQDNLMRYCSYGLLAMGIISIIMALVAFAHNSLSIIILYALISGIILGVIGTIISIKSQSPYIKSWGMYVIIMAIINVIGSFIVKSIH